MKIYLTDKDGLYLQPLWSGNIKYRGSCWWNWWSKVVNEITLVTCVDYDNWTNIVDLKDIKPIQKLRLTIAAFNKPINKDINQ